MLRPLHEDVQQRFILETMMRLFPAVSIGKIRNHRTLLILSAMLFVAVFGEQATGVAGPMDDSLHASGKALSQFLGRCC